MFLRILVDRPNPIFKDDQIQPVKTICDFYKEMSLTGALHIQVNIESTFFHCHCNMDQTHSKLYGQIRMLLELRGFRDYNSVLQVIQKKFMIQMLTSIFSLLEKVYILLISQVSIYIQMLASSIYLCVKFSVARKALHRDLHRSHARF